MSIAAPFKEMFEIPTLNGASNYKMACSALGLVGSIYILFPLPLGYDLPDLAENSTRWAFVWKSISLFIAIYG